MNNKMRKHIAAIVDANPDTLQKRRLAWFNHHRLREEFLSVLRRNVKDMPKNVRSKTYSSAVVQWDKEHRETFQEAFWGY